MKKNYQYDPSKFEGLMKKHGIRPTDLRNLFKYKNTITISKWREGSPIYADKICTICNTYGIDIHEFFVPVKDEEKEYKTEREKSLNEKHLQEEEQKEKMARLAAIPGVIEQIEMARVKERDYQEMLRNKDREVYETQLSDMQIRFEQRLVEKNERILEEQQKTNDVLLQKEKLEMQLDELNRRYRELELSTLKGASTTSGIAEKPGYLPLHK